jgi:hypothetical protein
MLFTLDDLDLDNLPEKLILVRDFVSFVGSIPTGGEGEDIDLVVRSDLDDEGRYVVLPQNLDLPLRNVFDKEKLEKLHLILNMQGPHGPYVPLYDLALVRVENHDDVAIKSAEDWLKKRFSPPGPRVPFLIEIFDAKEFWEEWGKDNVPFSIETKLNGFRIIARNNWIEMENIGKVSWSEELMEPFQNEVFKDTLLDGDAGILRDGRRLERINLIRLNGKNVKLDENEKLIITFFDKVVWKGKDLSSLDYRERRKHLDAIKDTLEKLSTDKVKLEITPYRVINSFEELKPAMKWAFSFDRSEGLVAKALKDSPYVTGAVSWMSKIKKFVEYKVQVVNIQRNKNGTFAYYCGVRQSPRDDYLNIEEGLVILGKTANTTLRAKKGDIITVKVLEVLIDRKGQLRWVSAIPQDIDFMRKEPYTTEDVVNLAKRKGILQVALNKSLFLYPSFSTLLLPGESLKGSPADGEEDDDIETRGEAALKFWEENWYKLFPESGRGKFILHAHWRGLSEDEIKLSHEELLKTTNSLHFDLRCEADESWLWGFTIFAGEAKENRTKNGSLVIDYRRPLRGTWKARQPHAWLTVGVNSPYVSKPEEVGATSRAYAKFFALDHGTYEMGVWHRHLIEIFLNGDKIKGRVLIQAVPVAGSKKRVWMFTRPKDQTPIAELKSKESLIAERKRKGDSYLVCAKPGEKPQLINLKREE